MVQTGLIADHFSSEWCHFSTTITLFNQVIHHNDKVKTKQLSSFTLKVESVAFIRCQMNATLADSQTETLSHSGTSFIRLSFGLTRAIFPFLRTMSTFVTFSSLNGVQLLCSAALSTSPACCHWLEDTHPFPTQKCPEETKTSKYRQKVVSLHLQSPPHKTRGPEVMIEQHYCCTSLYLFFSKNPADITFN